MKIAKSKIGESSSLTLQVFEKETPVTDTFIRSQASVDPGSYSGSG